MSEQGGKQPSTKQSRSRNTNTVNQENDKPNPAAQRPTNDDTEAWKAYWMILGQSWRTEPEIDKERQKYLTEMRNIKPDIEQGIYPFRDIKLIRADVEWLLATHENGKGPVNWNDEDERQRMGLDFRSADLRHLDLSGLPLANLRAGLTIEEQIKTNDKQLNITIVQMEGIKLINAHLEGAILNFAHLEDANLTEAHLEDAELSDAHLERADLFNALRLIHFCGVVKS
jgi:hypothetical protein